MAWETITCACGHDQRFQLLGKESDREYWRKRYASGICTECYKAEQERKMRDELAAVNAATLTGSEKQIDWAKKIRYDFLVQARKDIERYCAGRDATDVNATLAYIMSGKADAKWWIDNRSTPATQILSDVYLHEIKSK